jgi:hypothetical protein
MTRCPTCKSLVADDAPQGAETAATDIRAMKLRSGCPTDTSLAVFLGKAQSTIAMWRRRGSVPECALVEFEIKLRSKAE